MRTVIFDLDGTLADTSGDLIAAANTCFREMGQGDVLEPGRDSAVALRGGRAMLRLGLERVGGTDAAFAIRTRISRDETSPEREIEVAEGNGEAVIDSWYPRLLEAYESDIDRHTEIYPGAMEAVAELSGSGIAVGICTNKPENLAELLLARLGVRDAFDSLVGAGTLGDIRKPDPEPLREAARRAGGDPRRTVLVGDTETDRNTARAAGVPSILVTFGPSGAEMPALEPEGLIECFGELPALVDSLLP